MSRPEDPIKSKQPSYKDTMLPPIVQRQYLNRPETKSKVHQGLRLTQNMERQII